MPRALLSFLLLCAPVAARALVPCGNGTVTADEECDDANARGGDGCSEACAIEPESFCDNSGTRNRLVNGGFEDGAEGWTSDVVLGTGAAAAPGEVRTTETPHPRVNGACVRGRCLEGNAGGVVWRQEVSLQPATSYRFSAFAAVRSEGESTARLTLRVDGADVTPVFANDAPAPAPWAAFGAVFTTRANQAAAVLEVYNANAASAFNLDELALVRVPSVCVTSGPPDAGPPPVEDAGADPVVDAGIDAGTEEPDAAVHAPDAGEGASPIDAGSTPADAGGGAALDEGGCGCRSASPGLFAGLLALAARRRRGRERNARAGIEGPRPSR